MKSQWGKSALNLWKLLGIKHYNQRNQVNQHQNMISTKNLNSLPDRKSLSKICKAISVLDAIFSQEWEYRYYSYNSKWDKDEECLQMRNGSGDEMHILFREDGCVINGFTHEKDVQDKVKLTQNSPEIFSEFIFGEPIKSIGTTFCLWTTELKNWQIGQIENFDDNSKEMLAIFDGQPQTYINWGTEYFEINEIPLETVSKIYNGQTLTKKMVLSLVEELEDWEQLEKDLMEIDYPFTFQNESKKRKWKSIFRIFHK